MSLESIIREAAISALDGTLTDTERVNLYRLALTVAAAELHRIANLDGGVQPEPLLLIQQIGLLCDEDVNAERLLGGMGLISDDYKEAQDEAQSEDSE